MTSPSRRKRPTILLGPTRPARTWASLAALLALAAVVTAQSPPRPQPVATTPAAMPAAATPLSPVLPVRYQPAGVAPGGWPAADTSDEVEIQLEPPGLQRLSRLDSDEKLQERIRQRASTRDKTQIAFPEPPILSRDTYAGRGSLWQRRLMTVEPNFVCYGKNQPLFENTNMERYGWDFGPLSVPMEMTKFYADVVFYPMRAMADPCRWHECSAGHCLPGDPVPFLLYPPDITLTGVTAEVAVIGALLILFP